MNNIASIQLEQRTCAKAGCEKTFRCLPTSSSAHCSQFCAGIQSPGLSDGFKPQKRRGRPKGSKNVAKIELAPATDVEEIDETEQAEEPEVDSLEGEHDSPSDESDGVLADSLNDPASTGRPPDVDDGRVRATIGEYDDGRPLRIDVQRLIETRLLIQASSGGGKSYLIRKLLEETRGQVQHVVLDPEGEFNSLAGPYGYELADQAPDPGAAGELALRTLQSGRSLIVDLYDLPQDDRILFVKNFLTALMNAPRDHWKSLLVIVDEAHVFAPDKVKKLPSALAMIDLATRGRKRGFSCVLATQRLSKLHKDIAAECLNKLIGRTTLDIDLVRAAGDIGIRKADAPFLRTLNPGEFYAVGPAFGPEPGLARIGEVQSVIAVPTAGAEPPPPDDDRQALWAYCVEQARSVIDERRKARDRIVDLALKCCDIEWGGGGHWSGHEGMFTAKRFAQEVGVNYKTLMTWLRVRRLVADRLEATEWKDADYRFAHHAVRKLGASAPPEELLAEFRRHRDSPKKSYRLGVIVEWARSHRNFIQRADVQQLSAEDLRELRTLCEDTVRIIDDRLALGALPPTRPSSDARTIFEERTHDLPTD